MLRCNKHETLFSSPNRCREASEFPSRNDVSEIKLLALVLTQKYAPAAEAMGSWGGRGLFTLNCVEWQSTQTHNTPFRHLPNLLFIKTQIFSCTFSFTVPVISWCGEPCLGEYLAKQHHLLYMNNWKRFGCHKRYTPEMCKQVNGPN